VIVRIETCIVTRHSTDRNEAKASVADITSEVQAL